MIEPHNFRTGGTLPVAIHLRPPPADPKCRCWIFVRGAAGEADTIDVLAADEAQRLPIEGEA